MTINGECILPSNVRGEQTFTQDNRQKPPARKIPSNTITMRPSYLIISSLPLLALALPQPADDPNPQDIRFFGASYNGNGCPDGTAGYFFGLDGKKWTASYDSFVAHLEPNATVTEKITCDTIFKFTIPKGWQFTLETVNSRYTANIGLDVRGWIEAAFTFSGKSRDANVRFSTALINFETITKPFVLAIAISFLQRPDQRRRSRLIQLLQRSTLLAMRWASLLDPPKSIPPLVS